MHSLFRSSKANQILQISQKDKLFVSIAFKSTYQTHSSAGTDNEVEKITKIINDHPFPDHPLQPTLSCHIPPAVLSTSLVENVLGRLFAAHCNGLKASEFFKYAIHNSQFHPSSDAFEKTLHILTRMRYFKKAWELMEEIKAKHPSLLTLKALSIVLSRIARFQSFEDTLEAFDRLENDIYAGRKFGTEEFNILLRAFCTQRQMKEAQGVFNKFHSRFSPNTKTMNILLLGFKESGDVTSVELFYHDMVRRGFKPSHVTYNIRIDAYCKKGSFGDALRVFEAMKRENCLPTLETITTLIHGAGVARNKTKAKELFNEIMLRNLQADCGAYNALMSSLIRCRDVKSAASLMNEMEEKNIGHDDVTYHTMFLGLMRAEGIDSICELYHKMLERNFVPKTRTVVMLMKYFCENRKIELALNLWDYMMDRGYCPHSHALDLLVTGLCSRGRVEEAYGCSRLTLERGRYISEAAVRMLERYLLELGEMEKLRTLDYMMKKLQTVLPASIGHATSIPVLTSVT